MLNKFYNKILNIITGQDVNNHLDELLKININDKKIIADYELKLKSIQFQLIDKQEEFQNLSKKINDILDTKNKEISTLSASIINQNWIKRSMLTIRIRS